MEETLTGLEVWRQMNTARETTAGRLMENSLQPKV
jgi:hypothetical protein